MYSTQLAVLAHVQYTAVLAHVQYTAVLAHVQYTQLAVLAHVQYTVSSTGARVLSFYYFKNCTRHKMWGLSLGAFAKLRKATCWLRHANCGSCGRIFMKTDICVACRKYFDNIQFSLKSDKHNG